MKTLHLLRHAKSSWKDPGLDDHDRPLSKRGRETAKTIAAYLRRAKIAPDLVICSTAVRARQTLDPIAKAIKRPKVILEREIYEVAQEKIWKHLWRLPERADCVLLIGHNPGLHDLALALADADSAKLVPPRGGKFPTGAIASFRFDGAWKAMQPHSAVLLSFTRPKAMKKEGRSMTTERTVKLVAKANKKGGKATAAPRPAAQAAKAKKITGKTALVTQPAKETTKANKTATKTTVQRTTKVSTPKAKPKRMTAARRAPSNAAAGAANVARQASEMRSITPRPVTSPAGSVRPTSPTARGTSDQQPRRMSYQSRLVPLSDEIERDSQDSFPASDAPSWTPITRIGTPIPPKRGDVPGSM
jgi:phosphohistidine phosphatase